MNTLIAKFMGATIEQWYSPSTLYPDQSGVHVVYTTNNPGHSKHYSVEHLQYHTSWDWLMPVVEKIETVKVKGKEDVGVYKESIKNVEWSFTFAITGNQCTIIRDVLPQYHGGDDNFLQLYDCRNTSKIQSVYHAVVEFIKWYNKNK